MSIKTTKVMLKGIGIAMAVGAAMMMGESCMLTSSTKSSKKMIKKAVNKMEDIADTVMAFM